jgi:hypothetical protein
MDQATLTMLHAQAVSEITARIKSFMDFDTAKAEGRKFMEMAAIELGLSPSEGRKTHDAGFPEFNQKLNEWAEQKARDEFKAALTSVELEQTVHADRLKVLDNHRQDTARMLEEYRKQMIPNSADEGFIRLAERSHQGLVEQTKRFHREMADRVRTGHLLKLQYCFAGHLVNETTAWKLADTYEIKVISA